MRGFPAVLLGFAVDIFFRKTGLDRSGFQMAAGWVPTGQAFCPDVSDVYGRSVQKPSRIEASQIRMIFRYDAGV